MRHGRDSFLRRRGGRPDSGYGRRARGAGRSGGGGTASIGSGRNQAVPLLAHRAAGHADEHTTCGGNGRSDDREAPDHDGEIPAGFTYLGQFVDHDLTMDKTQAALGSDVTVDELIQGRSPALDLDSLYGRGPTDDPQFYSDGLHLKMGTTARTHRLSAGVRRPRSAAGPAAAPRSDTRRAKRREPGGRPDPPRLPQVPQPGSRHDRPWYPRQSSRQAREQRRQALPVDAANRLSSEDRRPGNRRGCIHQRPHSLRDAGGAR